jgi:hypothetical protein
MRKQEAFENAAMVWMAQVQKLMHHDVILERF